MFLLSLIDKEVSGKEAEETLGKAHITVNKNTVPNEPRSPFITSGIRIGTPAATTRGFGSEEVNELAGWMADILDAISNEQVIYRVRDQVQALCHRFPVYRRPE